MHPILFTIPGLDFHVRSFGLMVAAGFLLGTWILGKLVQRGSPDPKRDLERYGALPVWVLIGVVLGARALYIIVEIARQSPTGQEYLAQPWKMLAIWEGGLVMYGGMFGGMLGGVLCAKRLKLPIANALDLGVTAAFFGQAVGRIGCLLVGDDYGARVPERFQHLPFPLTLRVPKPLPEHSLFGEANAGQLLWATQPLMTIKALIVGCIGLWMLKRRKYAGQAALVMIVVYAILRSGVEFLRGDEIRGVWFGGLLSTSQMIAIASGLIALLLLVANRNRREPSIAYG
ncbi:MAG TPA: prolipoprotein diacylglyceryl transferase family protein [Planctomycetota bacterium]|nr:prolipoprotein diacylglyceryl transferase family protein [Planctomycetota bacterium]